MRLQLWAATAGLVLGASMAHAQTPAFLFAPEWTQVAGRTLSLGLAGPASGPVDDVWYAAGGGRLLAKTASGRVFETTDFQHWKLNSTDSAPGRSARPAASGGPETGVQVVASGARRYSATRGEVYASDDGRRWVDLTGFNGRSIIGDGFSSLAVSPANPLDIAAANAAGVWRSLDGGMSWQSLNEDLPNLTARVLAGQRTVVLADSSLVSATAGKWVPVEGTSPEARLRNSLAARSGFAVSAAAQSGSTIYAGMPDGTLMASPDEGATWTSSRVGGSGAIDRLWADPSNAQAALAAAGTKLFRTTNGGRFWDDVTGTLNAGRIHGIAADGSAGVVYAATDLGLYAGRLSLTAADLVPAKWSPLPGTALPIAAAWDARLNADGTLTVLLDGYGVYEAPAPHRAQTKRIVNGADMTDRAAAPGSLISVFGVNVRRATSGRSAYPVLLATEQSSQLQVPFEATPGVLQLAVESENGIWTAPLNVKQASPAIFVDADGTPMIQDAASALVIDAGTALRGGAVIQVLATGLGRVTPEWPTGVPAPVDSPPSVAVPVTAFLDGTPVRVTRATLAPTFVGTYLVELQLPLIVNRGAGELRIVVNGEESNRVKLYLDSGSFGQ